MRKFILLLCLLAAPVHAEDCALRGQWNISLEGNPNYVGVILIDAEARVTLDAPVDFNRPARYQGYIAKIEGTKVDIALTDRKTVKHLNCKITGNDELHCITLYGDGSFSAPYVLTRKAPGPKKLMPVIP